MKNNEATDEKSSLIIGYSLGIIFFFLNVFYGDVSPVSYLNSILTINIFLSITIPLILNFLTIFLLDKTPYISFEDMYLGSIIFLSSISSSLILWIMFFY